VKIFGRTIGCGTCIPSIDTPIGDACMRCDVPIKAGDVGIVMPTMGPGVLFGHAVEERPWHLACFRTALLGTGEPS
jgi:hypothetical protein